MDFGSKRCVPARVKGIKIRASPGGFESCWQARGCCPCIWGPRAGTFSNRITRKKDFRGDAPRPTAL